MRLLHQGVEEGGKTPFPGWISFRKTPDFSLNGTCLQHYAQADALMDSDQDEGKYCPLQMLNSFHDLCDEQLPDYVYKH